MDRGRHTLYMVKEIFVHVPVRDLERAKEFFENLGFVFNPQFSDDKAACMIIGKGMYAMLLTKPFFQTFTGKEVADAKKTSEVMIALSVDNVDQVNKIVEKAIGFGGREVRTRADHGWIYERSFEDPDGHIWGVVWLDPKALGGQEQ